MSIYVDFVNCLIDGKDSYDSVISRVYNDITSKLTKLKKDNIIKEIQDVEVENILKLIRKIKKIS